MNNLQIYIYSGEQLRTIQREDDLRAQRDHCRATAKQCERYVADEIALLTANE